MREDRFDAETDTALFGGKCGRESLLAGEMDDVAGSARVFQEGGETVGAFGFDRFRAAGFVPLGSGLALSKKLLLKPSHKFDSLVACSATSTESTGVFVSASYAAGMRRDEGRRDIVRRDDGMVRSTISAAG